MHTLDTESRVCRDGTISLRRLYSLLLKVLVREEVVVWGNRSPLVQALRTEDLGGIVVVSCRPTDVKLLFKSLVCRTAFRHLLFGLGVNFIPSSLANFGFLLFLFTLIDSKVLFLFKSFSTFSVISNLGIIVFLLLLLSLLLDLCFLNVLIFLLFLSVNFFQHLTLVATRNEGENFLTLGLVLIIFVLVYTKLCVLTYAKTLILRINYLKIVK